MPFILICGLSAISAKADEIETSFKMVVYDFKSAFLGRSVKFCWYIV